MINKNFFFKYFFLINFYKRGLRRYNIKKPYYFISKNFSVYNLYNLYNNNIISNFKKHIFFAKNSEIFYKKKN